MFSDDAPRIVARVRFLSAAEGGRLNYARDGIKPQLALGASKTSCQIVSLEEGVHTFEPGRVHAVVVYVPFMAEYDIQPGESDTLEFFEGSRKIATGAFVGYLR